MTSKSVARTVKTAQRNNARRKVLWAARNRALTELRKRHEAEYQELYDAAIVGLAPGRPRDEQYRRQ